MSKLFKKLITSVSLLTMLVTPLAASGTAFAGITIGTNNLECGAGGNLTSTAAAGCATDPNSGSRVQNIITSAINIFSIVIGLVCVVMIIIGGLKYVTSGGDSGAVSGAKNTILYAVVGLVIVAIAQVIVRFVLNRTNTAGV